MGPDLESADARCSATPPRMNSEGDASSLNHYRRLAGQWEEEQHPHERLLSGLELVALRCWVGSQPEGTPVLDPLILDWLEAGEANQPEDWFHSQLRERGCCNHCGNRYKLENLAICTCCSITLCPFCVGKTDRQSSRYRRCECGGDWVG
ncbi:hypothetical protein [Aestuariirhabdus litorea]|uniref:Uncharacterized protein n=1 Tax=Aestuariirhabdus litorea TaxID=2528527 RepID=A0A3P3VNA9_9GAMM|nr:hypothetical protein [Aestuariirhabdus litorea]RRJ84241.1 hypothetical protein D0544_03785 [Aestuariirhabdus litorea]RWW97463.1 hypothetical protein DZC74_03785 [Endozoicomonadaceae bacterium GTF-13]